MRKKGISKGSVSPDTLASRVITEGLSVSETEDAVNTISQYAKLLERREKLKCIASAGDAVLGVSKILRGDLSVSGTSLKERIDVAITPDVIEGEFLSDVSKNVIPRLTGPTFLTFYREGMIKACNELDTQIDVLNKRVFDAIVLSRREIIEQMIDKDNIILALNEEIAGQHEEIGGLEKVLSTTNESLAGAMEHIHDMHLLESEREEIITSISKEKDTMEKELKECRSEIEKLRNKFDKVIKMVHDIEDGRPLDQEDIANVEEHIHSVKSDITEHDMSDSDAEKI